MGFCRDKREENRTHEKEWSFIKGVFVGLNLELYSGTLTSGLWMEKLKRTKTYL